MESATMMRPAEKQTMMGQAFRLLALCALIFLAGFHSQSQAQSAAGATLGIVYGLSVPDADNTHARYLAGLSGTAVLSPQFSFGGYYLFGGAEQGGKGRDFRYSLAGLQARYHFGGNSGETYMGLMAGMTKLRTVDSNTEFILSPYHYGIIAGHDYPLFSKLSIGIEGFFIKVHDAETTNASVTYREDSFNIIGFLASIKLAL